MFMQPLSAWSLQNIALALILVPFAIKYKVLSCRLSGTWNVEKSVRFSDGKITSLLPVNQTTNCSCQKNDSCIRESRVRYRLRSRMSWPFLWQQWPVTVSWEWSLSVMWHFNKMLKNFNPVNGLVYLRSVIKNNLLSYLSASAGNKSLHIGLPNYFSDASK